MSKLVLSLASIAAAALFAFPHTAQAKTAKACDEEYKANKSAIKAGGEKKAEFVTRCRGDSAAVTAPLQAGAPAPAKETEAGTKEQASGSPSVTAAAPSRPERGKTAKACDEEYKANKSQIKASGEKKAEFVARCRTDSAAATAPLQAGAPAPAKETAAGTKEQTPAPSSPSGTKSERAKTAKVCDEQYKANKPAIRASGEKKAEFVARCRADDAEVTAALPAKAATPSNKSVAETKEQEPAAPAQPDASAAVAAPKKPARRGIVAGANQFTTEADAKAKCPADLVVWVNTKSKIYHFAGTRKYGRTKVGAYMCEKDTASAGFRAPKREKRPTV